MAASRLYQAMALEAADDDLDVEIYDELSKYSTVFEELALHVPNEKNDPYGDGDRDDDNNCLLCGHLWSRKKSECYHKEKFKKFKWKKIIVIAQGVFFNWSKC